MSFVGKNNSKISARPSGGGNKLQGITSTTDKRSSSIRAIQNRSWGENRNLIFCLNQLGGVGRNKSQFHTPADGVNCKVEQEEDLTILVNEVNIFVNKLNKVLIEKFGPNIKYKLCLIGKKESFKNDIKNCNEWKTKLDDLGVNQSELDMTIENDLNVFTYGDDNQEIALPPFFRLEKLIQWAENTHLDIEFLDIVAGLLKLNNYFKRLEYLVNTLNKKVPDWVNNMDPQLDHHSLALIFDGNLNDEHTSKVTIHDILHDCNYGIRVPSFANIYAYTTKETPSAVEKARRRDLMMDRARAKAKAKAEEEAKAKAKKKGNLVA